ncbi:oxygenase MpaB family protein [Parvularcula mediterranea]|uniref:oxygenase MpaB family protein n=1 Tax=Parvularcula mediterranea TaxID=2732508 RepID=UPI002FCD92B9
MGGIASVILELTLPKVRHGVWDHSVFPQDPVVRLKRTGLAAMVSFYGARSVALKMIEGVNQRHAKISGKTIDGQSYRATDPELLLWVQATAAWGFIEAYSAYAQKLSGEDWSEALTEAVPVAEAYGVGDPPRNRPDIDAILTKHQTDLDPSETLNTFLTLMKTTPTLPGAGRFLQPLFVRAAINLVPDEISEQLGLARQGLRNGERLLVQTLVSGSRLISLRNHPAALQRQRLGLNPR